MDVSAGAHEEFPMLYRSILSLLVELERQAGHDEARRIRAEATRAYSRAWDTTGRRRLEQLEARLMQRIADGPTPPRRWWRLSQ